MSQFHWMRFYHGLEQIQPTLRGAVVTIGNFDGVHKGHRAILQQVMERARLARLPAVLLTFDPHPIQVLFPERGLQRLFSVADLKEQANQIGLDILIVQPFDATFANLTAGQFLDKKIMPFLQPKELVVGHDFNFGANRSGTLEFLEGWCKAKQIQLTIRAPVEVDGERVSSRRIRELIGAGAVMKAERCLGRPFYLEGIVEKGDGRGRGIGVPTVNLRLHDLVRPKTGVYVTETTIRNQKFRSVSNLGFRPTFGTSGEVKLETHIFGFNSEIYGENIRVAFLEFLRDEKKFALLNDLKQQIQQDMQMAQQFQKGRT
jgi:riboflavin kinase/FMN adenylyltransferase